MSRLRLASSPVRLLACWCLCALPGVLPAARAQESQKPLPTLHANAKLVVVDVVVTGAENKPYLGLKQKDFTLFEDTKPQTILSFEEHTALSRQDALKYAPLPTLPPGVFSNYTPAPVNSAVNILLLDALNTPLKDQAFVRDQLLAYIKQARPGASIAIFGLTTQLRMLQGFTSNPDTLREAVKITSAKFSPLLDDQVGGGSTDSITDQLANMPGAAGAAAGLSNLESLQAALQLQLRAKYTLDAMSALARFLASVPGRKNLIWFSGSFPLSILPDGDAEDPFIAVADSEEEYRETTNLLARAQVAVYPVDARGLMTLPMFSAVNSGAKYARNPTSMTKDSEKFFNQLSNEHDTMQRMAYDTGGQAFVNTNGLAQAVDKAIAEGSNYYTLTYSPSNPNWKGDFRKIEVKLALQGYHLSFRHGYFADDPDSDTSALVNGKTGGAVSAPAHPAAKAVKGSPAPTAPPAPPANPMFLAMIHGLPGATQIVYKVRVLPETEAPSPTLAKDNLANAPGFAPSKGPFQRYLVDFLAPPADVHFVQGPDGHLNASLQFVSVVYDVDGKPVVTLSNTVDASVPADRFAALASGGLRFHQEISVPTTGTYTLRTGIHDVGGDRIGTVELPINSVKKLPAIAAP